jgi:hypothetical protein
MGREVKRVTLDFDWPLNKVWEGLLNPYHRLCSQCECCKGTGYSPQAKRFQDEWYGNAPFDPMDYGARPLTVDHPAVVARTERNVDSSPDFYFVKTLGREQAIAKEARRLFGHWRQQWSHHLIQADVDALVAGGRLYDFTHRFIPGTGWQPIKPVPVVTADAVNEWSLQGMGHDSINCWVCVKARCEREGYPVECRGCHGAGELWPSQAAKDLYENWKKIEPPAGDGWQMWETTSEGSPISPVFPTAEELARWLSDSNASAFGSDGASYEQWLGMCKSGWAPSAVMDAKGFRSGVEAIGDAA